MYLKKYQKIGILSTNSNFVNVIVNGRKMGNNVDRGKLGKIYLKIKRKRKV